MPTNEAPEAVEPVAKLGTAGSAPCCLVTVQLKGKPALWSALPASVAVPLTLTSVPSSREPATGRTNEATGATLAKVTTNGCAALVAKLGPGTTTAPLAGVVSREVAVTWSVNVRLS